MVEVGDVERSTSLRVAPNDRFYLVAEHGGLPLTMGLLCELGPKPDGSQLTLDDVRRVLGDRLVNRSQGFRVCLESDRAFTEQDFHLESVVQAVDIDASAPGALEALVSRAVSEPLGRRVGEPLWMARFVRAEGRRSFVLLAWQHAIADAYTAMAALSELAEEAEAPKSVAVSRSPVAHRRGWRSVAAAAAAEHFCLFFPLQLLAQLVCLPALLLFKAAAFLLPPLLPSLRPPTSWGDAGRGMRGGLLGGALLLAQQHVRYAWLALDAALFGRSPFLRATPTPLDRKEVAFTRPLPLAALLAAARAAGVTVNDALLGCLAGALRRTAGEAEAAGRAGAAPEPVLYALFNLRHTGAIAVPSRGPANRSGFACLRLPTSVGDVRGRIATASARMRLIKGSLQPLLTLALLRLLGRLPARLVRCLQRLLCPVESVLCTNVRGPEARLRIAGCPVLSLRPVAPACTTGGVAVALLSYAGEAAVTVLAPATASPRADALRDALEAELAAFLPPLPSCGIPAPAEAPLRRRPVASSLPRIQMEASALARSPARTSALPPRRVHPLSISSAGPSLPPPQQLNAVE